MAQITLLAGSPTNTRPSAGAPDTPCTDANSAVSAEMPCGCIECGAACVPVPAYVKILPVACTRRTTKLPLSEMYTSPEPSSTHTPSGRFSVAAVASPPSPAYPAEPLVPAITVLPLPSAAQRDTTCDPRSAMYTRPEASTYRPAGSATAANVEMGLPGVITLTPPDSAT
jgi:hypothetical protein